MEKLPVKIMVLNNQHLGMVVQWEDRFYKANRAHTYLGDPESEAEIYPDFCKVAEGFKVLGMITYFSCQVEVYCIVFFSSLP